MRKAREIQRLDGENPNRKLNWTLVGTQEVLQLRLQVLVKVLRWALEFGEEPATACGSMGCKQLCHQTLQMKMTGKRSSGANAFKTNANTCHNADKESYSEKQQVSMDMYT